MYLQLLSFTVSKSPSKEQEFHAQILFQDSASGIHVNMPLVSLESELPKIWF